MAELPFDYWPETKPPTFCPICGASIELIRFRRGQHGWEWTCDDNGLKCYYSARLVPFLGLDVARSWVGKTYIRDFDTGAILVTSM